MNNQAKKIIKYFIPYGFIELRRRIISNKHKLNYCPVCEQESEFSPMASTGGIRLRACCPNCGTLERHRLMWLFLNRKIGLNTLRNKSFLHVAAEPMLEPKFRKLVGRKYLTADFIEKADIKMDITDIKYKSDTFDVIICNHVLEHVSDDAKAMREMYRVLKKGGFAIFLVPLADMPVTYENNRVTTDDGRLKHFGQIDHVRKYGRDYIDRLKSAGWKVDIHKAKDIATRSEIIRMNLIEDAQKWGFTPTEIFYCTK